MVENQQNYLSAFPHLLSFMQILVLYTYVSSKDYLTR